MSISKEQVAAAKAFLEKADRNPVYGTHDAIVLETKPAAFPSGDPISDPFGRQMVDVTLGLETANNWKVNFTLGDLLSVDEFGQVPANLTKAVGLRQRLMLGLIEFYGIESPGGLVPGTKIRVKIVPNVKKGKLGQPAREFPLVVDVLPNTAALGVADAPNF